MDAAGLREALQRALAERGLARLVVDVVGPLAARFGRAWLDGRLAAHEERLFGELARAVLHQGLAQQRQAARAARAPRVLLATVPGEPLALGLLMAECLLVVEGCDTVPLGVQAPLVDIASAARAAGADVVTLDFSRLQSAREVHLLLARLRALLPERVELWAGGESAALERAPRRRRPGPPPARPHWPLPRLQDLPLAVARWRAEASRPDA